MFNLKNWIKDLFRKNRNQNQFIEKPTFTMEKGDSFVEKECIKFAKFNILDAILSIENIESLEKENRIDDQYKVEANELKKLAEGSLDFNHNYLNLENAPNQTEEFLKRNTELKQISKLYNHGYDSVLGQPFGRSYAIFPNNVITNRNSNARADSICAKIQSNLEGIKDDDARTKILEKYCNNYIDAMELNVLLKNYGRVGTVGSIVEDSQDTDKKRIYYCIEKMAERNYEIYAQKHPTAANTLKKEQMGIKKTSDKEPIL